MKNLGGKIPVKSQKQSKKIPNKGSRDKINGTMDFMEVAEKYGLKDKFFVNGRQRKAKV
jgi:hypothetical protein